MDVDEVTARTYLKLAFVSGLGVIGISLVAAIGAGLVADALGYNAAMVGGSVVALGVLAAVLMIQDGLKIARWMLVKQITARTAKPNAEAKKIRAEAKLKRAEAKKTLSEAALTDAQAEAIGASAANGNALQINTATNGGKITKPIVYTKAGQVVNGNQLVQINQPEARTLAITAADVRWFAEQLAGGFGHSKSKWVNVQELPYSRLPVTYEIYKTLIDPLVASDPQAIVGRGERASGHLVETDPAQLVKIIEQTYPGAGSKGIVLQLPPALP